MKNPKPPSKFELEAFIEEMSHLYKHDAELGDSWKYEIAKWIAEKAFLKAQELYQPRWIPVSERLPETEFRMKVLGYNDENKVISTVFFERIKKKTTWFTTSDEVNITHWQPLPPAPSAEGESND